MHIGVLFCRLITGEHLHAYTSACEAANNRNATYYMCLKFIN